MCDGRGWKNNPGKESENGDLEKFLEDIENKQSYWNELENQQTSILNLLHKTMAESLNELGFNIAERLTAYSLIRGHNKER